MPRASTNQGASTVHIFRENVRKTVFVILNLFVNLKVAFLKVISNLVKHVSQIVELSA